MKSKRVHVVVIGRVQGVFFREYTLREAQRLCLTGWVRNLADGSVEAEFQGAANQVNALLEWLSTGSPLSLVTGIDSQPMDIKDNELEFVVQS
ncbi:MAG: acylphosphatase [Desulfobulbus sp.]|nr:MAG: acylphosphatase [Desulfobulbus sp.]